MPKGGVIAEGPYQEMKTGNWRLKLQTISAGDALSVVVELDSDNEGNYSLVITTF